MDANQNEISVDQVSTSSEYDLSDWMAYLPPSLTSIPVCHLAIPGSHDSGADNTLDDRLPVANDESWLIKSLGKLKWIRKGIRRWAVTQRLSIAEQLMTGVRYFDLRVSRPPDMGKKRIQGYRLVHALYGSNIVDSLKDVKKFLEEHTQEIVILDINHLFNMSADVVSDLQSIIISILGTDLICPAGNPYKTTLNSMRESGKRVIIMMHIDNNTDMFWPGKLIFSPWPDTNELGELMEYLKEGLANQRRHVMGRFFVTQGVLTAHISDVIVNWFSTLETCLSLKTTSSVSHWMNSILPSTASAVNIVLCDFVDDSFCRTIIDVNYRKPNSTKNDTSSTI